MDPISIGAGVVIASYLVPLIITCVIAGVTIVATFFVTRYVYKSKEKQAKQRAEAYQQQYAREMEVREGLCQVASQAGIDVQTLIELSQKHQEAFQKALCDLVKNVHESTTTTEKLNQVAISIQHTAQQTAVHTEKLSEELQAMKLELTAIYKKLHDTEKALAEREKELQETITKLQSIEHLTTKSTEQQKMLDAFLKDAEFISGTVAETPTNQSHEELLALREENRNLHCKIKQLSETMSKLHHGLTHSNSTNQQYLHEIQSLLKTNEQLSQQIEHLTRDLENQNTSYQPRLFK